MDGLIYFPVDFYGGGWVFGVSLIFVGAGLMNNGMCGLRWGLSGTKHAAPINLITGFILLLNNIPALVWRNWREVSGGPGWTTDLLSYGSNLYWPMLGIFFGFVYVFIGFNALFKLDPRPYGVFSLGNSLVLFPMVILDPDWRFKFMWFMWSFILFIIWYESVLGKPFISPKFTYKLCIFQAITTGYIPGLMMLLGIFYPF